MIGNDSIDFGLKNIWNSWTLYRKGKKISIRLDKFEYNLEKNLFKLHGKLINGTYRHGGYYGFAISDNKKRNISVASIEDRVVHRLIYDYLVPIFDKTFIYDAWSCRKGKGLTGAIERTQGFLCKNRDSFIWKADIRKFFENVDHEILLNLIGKRVQDKKALWLIKEVIESFPKGIPIGNLTSQIFANIYLNELDRFVKYNLKPKFYLRYGDDFILIHPNRKELEDYRLKTVNFLKEIKLELHSKNDIIIKAQQGLKFLGTIICDDNTSLGRRMRNRIRRRLNIENIATYRGMVAKYDVLKLKELDWRIMALGDRLC